MNALVQTNQEAYRASTDAASMCRDIVIASATTIQGRSYINVEGWMAIAVAHGCCAAARDVEAVEGGVRAVGEVRRMSDGIVLSTAEGFVGEDEPTWYGGTMRGKTMPKRADYAIRAMAQTRAISRACRSAFAHVVVMMKANLSTTPAEEVPYGGFDNGNVIDTAPAETHDRRRPAARQKLDGQHTSGTALKKAVSEMVNEVRSATSEKRIDAILKLGKGTIREAEAEWPDLLTGDPNIEEDTGLKGAVADRRKLLQDSPATKLMLEAREQAFGVESLGNWYTVNSDAIERLSDADRDIFDKEHQAYESELEKEEARTPMAEAYAEMLKDKAEPA